MKKVFLATVLSLMVSACGDSSSETYPITPATGGSTNVGTDPIVDPITDPVVDPVSTDSDFVSGGLGESGDWKGYLFTASDDLGSTITPDAFTGSDLCVSGELAADPSWGTWAMVGWNIAQDVDPSTFEGGAVNSISPGGDGISVKVENNAGTKLRVQIQTDETGSESWCTDIPSTGEGNIPWSDFTKECWNAGGESYDGVTPIAQIAVQVPAGSDTATTPFDYCVISLGSF